MDQCRQIYRWNDPLSAFPIARTFPGANFHISTHTQDTSSSDLTIGLSIMWDLVSSSLGLGAALSVVTTDEDSDATNDYGGTSSNTDRDTAFDVANAGMQLVSSESSSISGSNMLPASVSLSSSSFRTVINTNFLCWKKISLSAQSLSRGLLSQHLLCHE